MNLRRRRFSAVSCVLLLLTTGGAVGLTGCGPKTTADAGKDLAQKAAAGATAQNGSLDADKTRGRWVRSDGGYVLAISSIDPDGRANAAYYNPDPVKVAWSRVTKSTAGLTVLVELRDVNYPGCLYKLTYEAKDDRLVGTYFQAQQQETYQVEFQRER